MTLLSVELFVLSRVSPSKRNQSRLRSKMQTVVFERGLSKTTGVKLATPKKVRAGTCTPVFDRDVVTPTRLLRSCKFAFLCLFVFVCLCVFM